MKTSRIIIAVLFLCGAAFADTIVCQGVVGNSGQSGKTLVRFADKPARGMGVVYDRFGSLWDRGGRGRLNRYAPDGRLLGSYEIPSQEGRNDKITIAENTLVLLIGKNLYTLDISSPPGTKVKKLKATCEHLSFGSSKGHVACSDKEKKLFLLDPVSGVRKQVADLSSQNRIDEIEMIVDGTIYVRGGQDYIKVVNGKVVSGWTRKMPGERAQLIGDYWYTNGWHGTIKRFDSDMQPAPGVVLGGASGHFIGHLPQNSELLNGRGMARLRPFLYAVSGMGGVMHLMQWDIEDMKMKIIRRIGALQSINGIGLDREGRIWACAGSWEWNDGPASPMRFGVNTPESPGITQAVMLENDNMVAAGFLWGRPTFYAGTFDKEIKAWRMEKDKCDMRKSMVGAAAYRHDRKLILLLVNAKGETQAFCIGADGRFLGNEGEVKLTTASKVEKFTTLGMKDDNTLLAAGDGHVIEFARDGASWKETKRWNQAGSEKFGNEIHISSDEGRLWVSDTTRHRIVCVELTSGKAIASFGTADKKGDDLLSFSSPRAITARGRRAVVYDSDNQRLMKFELKAGEEK